MTQRDLPRSHRHRCWSSVFAEGVNVEAAIGIELMNKGFAVFESLFFPVQSQTELCLFVGSSSALVRVR
jgi:hypothetical protein